jgi:hypothetical protein
VHEHERDESGREQNLNDCEELKHALRLATGRRASDHRRTRLISRPAAVPTCST